MLHPEAPAIVRIILALHILAGTVALFVVPVVMIVRKGGPLHRRLGLIFVYAMFTVAVTAVVEAPYFRSYFLLLIAVFSAYLTFLGWRALSRKRPDRDAARAPDWIGAFAAIGAGAGMIAMGFVQHRSFGSFSIVLFVLGAICMNSAARSIYGFIRPTASRTAWLFDHFRNMLAAYIATVTAFSAVNLSFIRPVWLQWLWPTIIGSIVIAINVRHYRQKIAGGARVRDIVTVREPAAG